MYLAIRPVWETRRLTQEELEITNTLYKIFQITYGHKRSVAQQVKAAKTDLRKQKISPFTGNVIDRIFKDKVEAAKARGKLPAALHVIPIFEKGSDIWLERVAWDIITAEQGRYHIMRDVYDDLYRWDFYFVLGY
jgi:hypothetical protein